MLLQLNDKRICWAVWKGPVSLQMHGAAVLGGNAEQPGGGLFPLGIYSPSPM